MSKCLRRQLNCQGRASKNRINRNVLSNLITIKNWYVYPTVVYKCLVNMIFQNSDVVFWLPFYGESQICNQKDGGYFKNLLEKSLPFLIMHIKWSTHMTHISYLHFQNQNILKNDEVISISKCTLKKISCIFFLYIMKCKSYSISFLRLNAFSPLWGKLEGDNRK